jgi:hypothetical protein
MDGCRVNIVFVCGSGKTNLGENGSDLFLPQPCSFRMALKSMQDREDFLAVKNDIESHFVPRSMPNSKPVDPPWVSVVSDS